MKGIIVGTVLLGVVAGCVYTFFLGKLFEDRGHQIPVAFGVPDGSTIQMHVAISPSRVRRDAPQIDNKGRVLWREWVEAHFTLSDESGKKQELQRAGMSGLMIDAKATGSPDCYLIATLTQGTEYTFEYTPVVAEPDRYRHVFTAPAEPQEVWHRQFDLIEDG